MKIKSYFQSSIIKLLLVFLSFSFSCESTDLKPWFGNEYEVELRATALYQNYNSIAQSSSSHRHCHRSHQHDKNHCNDFNANDGFFTLSAAYPFKRYCGEFEATSANTHHQNCRWDNFRATGRYQWFSERECDPLTLTFGLTITQAYSRALHDISSFHHGHVEGELTAAFGKEYGFPETGAYWFRWWNVLGIGTADNSSEWIREDLACEFNYDDVHEFRGFVNTLWGLGHHNIRPCQFSGYGLIRHKSIDVGVRYGYTIGCFGTLSIQYARRVFARNFPENANLVLVEYYFPFGTQTWLSY